MKKLILTSIWVAFFTALFISCSPDNRTVIKDRWSNGAKKTVITYKGEGVNEKLIEERLYTANGTLYRIINHTINDTLNIFELNSPDIESIIGNWKKIRPNDHTDTTFVSIDSTMSATFQFVNYFTYQNQLTSIDTTEIWEGIFLNSSENHLNFFLRKRIFPPTSEFPKTAVRKYNLTLGNDGALSKVTTFPSGKKDTTKLPFSEINKETNSMEYTIKNDTLILNWLNKKRYFLKNSNL